MTVLEMTPPRIQHIPDCFSNAADEAIELAAACGLMLDPWQQFVLRAWLGEDDKGIWSSPINGLSVPRQNGKGSDLEARELYGLVILGERILHTAHETKTSKDHFRRMRELFEHPELKDLAPKFSFTNGEESITLNNGARIKFIARSKNSGRGFTADLLVCDEAQDLDDDKFSALLPTISSVANPQTIMTGTPPSAVMAGEVFGRFRDQGLDGTNTRLSWIEYSADRTDDIDSPATWERANPALGIRIKLSTVTDERSIMDDETFARERLGMWSGIASLTLFDMEAWGELATDLGLSDPVAFAIDVSPDRDMASIGVAGYIGQATRVEVIENRSGTGWIVERVKELRDKWNPVAIVIDQGSPAASLLTDFQTARVRITTTGTSEMAQACGAFYDAVNNERILHFDQPALNSALAAATKRPLRDAFAWNRKNPNADITPLVAVTLAAHGLTTKRKPKGQDTGRKQRGFIL